MNPRRESSGGKKSSPSPMVRGNLRVVRSVSYADIPSDLISDIVLLVTKHGAAVMFGLTSDQGAYSFLVLDNNNKIKEYPHDETELSRLYTWLRDEYFADGGKPAA